MKDKKLLKNYFKEIKKIKPQLQEAINAFLDLYNTPGLKEALVGAIDLIQTLIPYYQLKELQNRFPEIQNDEEEDDDHTNLYK